MKVWLFLRPTFVKLSFVIVALTLTLFIISEREATSKVTWEEHRGAPLPFLSLMEYRGPCGPDRSFCVYSFFNALHPVPLLADVLGWYIVSCTLAVGYDRVLRHQRLLPFLGSGKA